MTPTCKSPDDKTFGFAGATCLGSTGQTVKHVDDAAGADHELFAGRRETRA
ncbi:hypothetical protein M728_005292 (plasmid) [Ensifer sp. WSM1721]|uniref:hypothetical protein n=1 Tax=Ensifer sp. WSM1721 TaxID=1041159 RepID=UPI0004B6DC66|nr:hypothetical protein [Ensifer sp. WSM1721]